MNLYNFICESNHIEGIDREPTYEEITAHELLLASPALTVANVSQFVWMVAKAPLRDRVGMYVMIGRHHPPPGGPNIKEGLGELLDDINQKRIGAYRAHVAYETLHAFMDGNGRSGRAIWAWQTLRAKKDPFALGFLHNFYYQALDSTR